jgi:UTP--glucose-1-phosphate uridylyltransferase
VEGVYAYRFEGRRFDCGSKLGFLEATLEYAYRDADIGEKFAEYVNSFHLRHNGAGAG